MGRWIAAAFILGWCFVGCGRYAHVDRVAYRWEMVGPPGVTAEQAKKDSYECEVQTRMAIGNPFYYGDAFGAAFHSLAVSRDSRGLYARCMDVRGYHREKVSYIVPAKEPLPPRAVNSGVPDNVAEKTP